MLPNRKLNRLQGFDYSQDRTYFVSFNTKGNIHWFGKVDQGKMIHSSSGEILAQIIERVEDQYSYVIIHRYIIMPDHVHILIEINGALVRTGRDLPAHSGDLPAHSPVKIKSLSEIIGAIKMLSSKHIRLTGLLNFAWHRSFHDRIVRTQREFDAIDYYIIDNPRRWKFK